jgi:hypothetical protein
LAAAVADVGANRRGKSIADVADDLGVRLVADGIQLPREVLMWHARDIVEPYWPLLHPIEVIRGMWASRGADDEDSLEEPALFDGEATEDREDALGFLLREHPDVRSVNFSTSAANVVEVFLMPSSEVAAQLVRDVCSPREVRFVDDLPQWRDWNDRWG